MTSRAKMILAAQCAVMSAAAVVMWIVLMRSTGPLRVIAAYTTSLEGRTPAQIYNARRAAQALDGVTIFPGRTFSFNRTVGGWSADAGFKKAPVSFDGELVRDWGGGVCQTSTTLYNAALLAGMKIVERHRHYWPTTYVEPGRDAAVAFDNVDLRFTNPFPRPVRLSAQVRGSRLTVRLLSRCVLRARYHIVTSVRRVNMPSLVTRSDPHLAGGRRRTIVTGAPGYDVEVYRVGESRDGHTTREVTSRDVYPVLHEVVAVGARP